MSSVPHPNGTNPGIQEVVIPKQEQQRNGDHLSCGINSRHPPPRRAKSEAVERMCQRLSHLHYPLPSLYSPKRADLNERPKPRLPPEEIAALRAQANLSRIQYHVTQECGTEPSGSGQYLKLTNHGMYLCVICGAELFSSDSKFDSYCGWPAFYDIVNHKNVNLFEDKSHGMVRTKVSCSQCGAHLGHLFAEKFRTPTGQRYCINSASLKFQQQQQQKQAQEDVMNSPT